MFDPARKFHAPEAIPLELLQWWLFVLEFEDRVERDFSQEELAHINKFNAGLAKMRQKLSNSKIQETQKKRQARAQKDLADKVFFIEVIKHVKHSVEAYEEDSSVLVYKRLLVDDMRSR